MGCSSSKTKKKQISRASVVPFVMAKKPSKGHRRNSSVSTNGTDIISLHHHHMNVEATSGKTTSAGVVALNDDSMTESHYAYAETSITNDMTPLSRRMQFSPEFSNESSSPVTTSTMPRLEAFSERLRMMKEHEDPKAAVALGTNLRPRVTERAYEEEDDSDYDDDDESEDDNSLYSSTSYDEIERISSFVRYNSDDLKKMKSFGAETTISNDDTLDRAVNFRMNTEQLLATMTSIDYIRTDTFDHASPEISPDVRRRYRMNNFFREESFTGIPEDATAEDNCGLGETTVPADSLRVLSLPTQHTFINNKGKSEAKIDIKIPMEFEISANLEKEGSVANISCGHHLMYVSDSRRRAIRCRFPDEGDYQLNVLAKKRGSEDDYVGVMTFYITNVSACPSECTEFPEMVSVRFPTVSSPDEGAERQINGQKIESGFIENVEILSGDTKRLQGGEEMLITILAPTTERMKYSFDQSEKHELEALGDFFLLKTKIPADERVKTLRIFWELPEHGFNMIKYNIVH